jgi:hypothetical protein
LIFFDYGLVAVGSILGSTVAGPVTPCPAREKSFFRLAIIENLHCQLPLPPLAVADASRRAFGRFTIEAAQAPRFFNSRKTSRA